MSSSSNHPFSQELLAERRRDRRWARAFANACASGDIGDIYGITDVLGGECIDGWRLALKKILRQGPPSRNVQMALLQIWVESKSVRLRVGDDLLTLKALRLLLPPYAGPPVKLYRGEDVLRWRRRAYGISWTADLSVARKFAQIPTHVSVEGGSLLLETVAPSEAIISTSHLIGDHYEEQEYMVDRRKLGPVKVLKRFAEIPLPMLARNE